MPADPAEALEKRLIDGAPVAPISLHVATRTIELIDLEGVECREPFFDQTIQRLEQSGARRTGIDFDGFLRAVPRDRTAPDGFIFHAGRCGSTLMANMLEASGGCAVLKEPRALLELSLAWLEGQDDDVRRELESLLALVVPQLLWATAGGARFRVLKPAAWNIQLAGVLLRIFPTTPAVFMYRAPCETVASMLFEPPAWLEWIERPRTLHACLPSLRTLPADLALSETTLFAHAWRSAAEAALALPPERMIFLDYADMVGEPARSLARVLAHFRQPADPPMLPAMLAACSIYSKDPARTARFDPGGAHRRPSLTSQEIGAIEIVIGDLMGRLIARERA
jgi:Sulfotransferase family